MPLIPIDDLVAPPAEWRAQNGMWEGDSLRLDGTAAPLARLLTSPEFELGANRLALFSLSAAFTGACEVVFGVEQVGGRGATPSHAPGLIHSRLYEGLSGACTMSIAFRSGKAGRFRLALQLSQNPPAETVVIGGPQLLTQGIGEGRISKVPIAGLSIKKGGDYLPHWGVLKRFLHRRCRNSRLFNTIVSATEMRLGCEEIISLPQYVALCPTGQCNALCDFCSVTINRTGILKQQLPFDQLEQFLAPVEKTIRLYGMEGNGEPTLYARFPELAERLTRSDGKAYLITNGSRLESEDVPLAITLESINFSLNAATAETHRRVMKLKNFEDITSAIRGISRQRGRPAPGAPPSPQIYTSMVVTNHNVHEVQDFLCLVDKDLGVDVVMVRPLSELGNDLGAVEDLRDIVPFESDIRDMIDAVADYVADMSPRAQIRLNGDTFASFRPDPIGRLQMPLGFEGRLLAPRRGSWHSLDAGVTVQWRLNTAHFDLPAVSGKLIETDPIDIEPCSALVFEASVTVAGGPVTLAVHDDQGAVVGTALLTDTEAEAQPVSIMLQPQGATRLALALIGEGQVATVDIDFKRLRTPAPYVGHAFTIPDGHRWELSVPDAGIEWSDTTVRVTSTGGGGPYILKSYGIACARNRVIELPVEVEVHEGAISIGVLNATSAKFLEIMEFTEPFSRNSLFFQTGDNDTVRLVIYAAVGPNVDASITWHPQTASSLESGEPRQAVGLPDLLQWRQGSADAIVDKTPSRVNVSWHGQGSPYLLKSNKFWCAPNQEARFPLALRVREGQVAVGVLDAVGDSWLHKTVFDQGDHLAELDFRPGSDGRVSAVIAAVTGAPAEIEVALTADALGTAESAVATLSRRARRGDDQPRAETKRETAAAATAIVGDQPAGAESAAKPVPRLAPPRIAGWRRLRRALRPTAPLACQKPWTDLNNFSVDGRVDVCCIATGPSQTRYQLGNLNTNSFQEVWNGQAAREFRRTVNTDTPLPPCARCPMLRSFQGLWFDPTYTRDYVERRTIEYIHGKEVDSAKASLVARALARAMGKFATSLFQGY